MAEKKGRSIIYENLARRKDSLNTKFNNFTINPPTNPSMTVYQSGHKSNCEPGWHTRIRTYDHYIIHYVLDGSGIYYSPTETFPINKGDLFLIRPDESIHYQADWNTPWTYYWVGFNGNEAPGIVSQCGFSDTCLKRSYTRDNALTETMHRLAYPEFQGVAREYELLGDLYRAFSLLMHTHVQRSVSKTEQYLTRAIEYIQQKYSDTDLRVGDIAGYVGIDRTYLYRIFYDSFQQSVQDFVLEFRLSKAKSLLKYSDSSVGLIAYSCGFENQSYFSTIFKKSFHKTPLQYRKEKLRASANTTR